MEIIIKLKITVDDEKSNICGECFFKDDVFYSSGQPSYRCRLFKVDLVKTKEQPIVLMNFLKKKTERCTDCLLTTGHTKDYMYS